MALSARPENFNTLIILMVDSASLTHRRYVPFSRKTVKLFCNMSILHLAVSLQSSNHGDKLDDIIPQQCGVIPLRV